MISLRNASKQFGKRLALDRVSFSVAPGEIVALLGRNGAGKTTVLRLLAGYLYPDVGEVLVAGERATHRAARAQVGYLPESVPLYLDMRVDEYLTFRARLKGAPARQVQHHVKDVVDAVQLDARTRRRVIGKLSKGYRQRVGLADALLGGPRVVLLDEPTAGLDPAQQDEFRALLKRFASERAVVLASHLLPEVEAVASRAVILAAGKIVAIVEVGKEKRDLEAAFREATR